MDTGYTDKPVERLTNTQLVEEFLQSAYDSDYYAASEYQYDDSIAIERRNSCQQELTCRLAAAEGLEKKLLALTPGGSEYHGSPARCFGWIKDRLSSTGRIAKERNELRARLAAAEALAEALRPLVERLAQYQPLADDGYRQAVAALAAWDGSNR